MSDDTEQYLDNVLSFMALSDPKYKFEKMHRYPLSHFSPSLVVATPRDEAIAESLDANVNTPEIFADAEVEDVRDCKVDISVLTAGSEEGIKYQVCRYRLLSAQEKRGLYFAGFPAVEAVYGHISEDGTFNTGKVMYVRRGQKWLVAPGRANPMSPMYTDENTQSLRCVFGLIFRQYFKWTVTLGYEGFVDCYVFCLFTQKDAAKAPASVLDTHSWRFYVLSTPTINNAFKDQETVSLSVLEKMVAPISYEYLKHAIEDALA